jgi:hypothetical protein
MAKQLEECLENRLAATLALILDGLFATDEEIRQFIKTDEAKTMANLWMMVRDIANRKVQYYTLNKPPSVTQSKNNSSVSQK